MPIFINQQELQLGSPLPAVITSVIIHIPIRSILIPAIHKPQIQVWIKTIIQNSTCEYIDFNNTLIPAKPLKASYDS